MYTVKSSNLLYQLCVPSSGANAPIILISGHVREDIFPQPPKISKFWMVPSPGYYNELVICQILAAKQRDHLTLGVIPLLNPGGPGGYTMRQQQ